LLAQFFQVAQGYSAFEAGLRILPWTVMPIFIAPIAGALSDRIGGRPWLAAVMGPTVAYIHFVPGFVMAGTGMALVFAPAANTVLGAVRPTQAGQASGATNAIRELGGVLGVSVLATVFSAHGGYASPQDYVDGLIPAVCVGAAVLFAGALVALLIPSKRPQSTVHSPQEVATA